MTEQEKHLPQENVLAGTVGALLFSLAGGVLWYVLYQLGYLAGISGLVAAICAIKGYAIFAKKESVKGVVISVLVSIAMMVLSWYLCLATDVYNAYQDWFAAGEVDFTVSYADSVRYAYHYLYDPGVMWAYWKDLGLGLLFCVLGSYRFVLDAIRRVKREKEAAAAPATPVTPEAAKPEGENDSNAF